MRPVSWRFQNVGTYIDQYNFENVSKRNNTLHVFNTNDETQIDIPDEVSELSVPGTHYDRQPHTHHMVTRKTAQTIQITEFFTGRILKPRESPSHQHQELSTEVSQYNILPMFEEKTMKSNFSLKEFH